MEPLTLVVSSRRIASALNAPSLASLAPTWKPLNDESIYYDTPGLRLHRHGVALSVCRKGRRWQQQLARAAATTASVCRFVADGVPHLGPLDTPLLGEWMPRDAARVVLKPVFERHVERLRTRLRITPATRILVCVDRGWLRSRKKTLAISEIELTLLSGEESDVLQFAAHLRESVPFVVEPRRWLDRGYALRSGITVEPTKARHDKLHAGMSIADACSAVASGCIAHFETNQVGMLQCPDTEFVHQMRVALRRLRSALATFRDAIPSHAWEAHLADMRWLGRSLGPARDWDVFMTDRWRGMKRDFKHEPGIKAIETRCVEVRAKALVRARRAVHSMRCQRFLLTFRATLASRTWTARLTEAEREGVRQDVVPYAASVLERRYDVVRRRGRNIARLHDADLHRLRIAVKKLRYASEFFGMLFDADRFEIFRTASTDMQDVLGRINDTATANGLLASIIAPDERDLMVPRALLLGWNRHEAHRLKTALSAAWQQFRSVPPFWRVSTT